PERGVERRGDRVDASRLVGVDEKRLDLRGEAQFAVDLGPEKRLLARAVAREDEAPRVIVPHGEPEHALQPAHRVRAEARVQRDDGLDVALRPEGVARRGALAAERGRVVNLPVAYHPDRAVRALEGLVS